MVKAEGAQWESDGVVVPMAGRGLVESGVQHNALVGKGPCFGDAGRVGKRESQAAMKRLRGKVRDRTVANRAGTRIEWMIEDLDPILRGWGNYFRAGNAARKFGQIDDYVYWRLRRLQVKKRGRNLRAGEADQWASDWFVEMGLYRLRGTVRYPKAA